MHSLRRFAARAALPAARGLAQKPQASSFAAQFARPSVPARIASVPAARFFSQTAPVANAAEEEAAVQSAISEAAAGEATSPNAANLSERESPYCAFIRNLVFQANEEHVKEAFSKYGEVASVVIARDARSLSKGWGFVYFETEEGMNRAIAEADGSFWHGRRIQCQQRTPRAASAPRSRGPARNSPSEPTTQLYIGNIPYETTDAELSRIFHDLENVEDIRVAADHTTGWPRGFAHADFADVESAQRALEKLKGMRIGDRELRVDFAAERQKDGKVSRRGREPFPVEDQPSESS